MSLPSGSLAETVAATAIEGVLAALTAAAVIATLGVTAMAGERALALAELVRLDAVVASACARVDQPADPASTRPASGDAVTISRPAAAAGYASVRFLDGSPDRTLGLAWSPDGVEVRVGEEVHRFVRVTLLDLRLVERPMPHLALSLALGTDSTARALSLLAPFGCLHAP
jgi:hypothetical protein